MESSCYELEKKYPKGSIVSGHVRRLLNYGAEVKLEDGAEGIIRNRELLWDREPSNPSEVLKQGQSLKAMVIGLERERGRLKLSLRQTERDPWAEIDQRYRVGQVLRGKVVRLWYNGAFIEVEQAVDGFISLHETCASPPELIDKVLLVGDTVEAVITRLNHKERQVELSIKEHLERLEQAKEEAGYREYAAQANEGEVTLGESLRSKDLQALIQLLSEQRQEAGGNKGQENTVGEATTGWIRKILLVDDDDDFRLSMERLLNRFGYQVETAETGEVALTLFSANEYNLVLMDLGLPDKVDGLEATRCILASKPTVPVVIITGIDWIERHTSALEEAKAMGVRSALLKPVDIQRLQDIIKAIAEGRDAWPMAQMPETIEGKVEFLGQLPDLTPTHSELHKVIQETLLELQNATGATACLLFHMLPATSEVQVYAHTGVPLGQYETTKYTLQATPIDNVIRRGEQLYEPYVSRNPLRFRYLKQLLDFSSCIGVPVKTFGQSQYGLFLFHTVNGHFTSGHFRQATIVAERLGQSIAWQEVKHAIQHVQPLILIGQLGAVLVHEINNKLTSVGNYAKLLEIDHAQLEDDPTSALQPWLRDEMGTSVRGLLDASRNMQGLTQLFVNFMRREKYETLNVNEVILRTMHLLEPVALRNKVKMIPCLEEQIPFTLGVGVRLEQVFVNVMLNAIQQTGLSKGGGELIIHNSFEPQESYNSQLPIKVRFTDNGPGIHGQHLDKIFTMGFSTRPEGTGLGLFITKGLVESLGGRISVEDSVVLVGTTFLVELPLIIPSREEGMSDGGA
jgi:signal transduction histidine kinase/predicted RNA-binding protein with RPS1 domain/DNA-binding response OmpR family regulator